MASLEYPLIPGGTPEERRRQQQALTEQWLGELVSEHGLDLDIAAAYAPAATSLYTYPGMEPAFGYRLDELKAASVQEFHEVCVEAYVQRFDSPQARESVAKLQRRLRVHGSAGDPVLTAELVKRSTLEGDLALVMARGYFGLARSDLYGDVLQADYLHYFFEVPGGNLPLALVGDASGDIKDFAVGPDVPAEALGLRDVAFALRFRDAVDLSEAHLDARFASTAAIVQFEAASLLLAGLARFASLKPIGGPRRAAALAERYRSALMEDDTAGKVELARAVEDLFRQYRRQVTDRRARMHLSVMARDAAVLADELPDALDLFGLVYLNLGYELPLSLLRQPEADNTTNRNTAVGNLMLRGQLEQQQVELNAQIEAFSAAWRLGARARRERGLDAMQRALVNGFKDAGGADVLDAISKAQAQRIIDVVTALDALVQRGSPDDRLAAALAEEASLREQVAGLQATAKTAGVALELAAIASVRQIVEVLRADWPGYRQLIIETWPGQQGRAVAQRLEVVLAAGR